MTDYSTLRVNVSDRVARVVIDAPPINVMTLTTTAELLVLSAELAADDSVSVVVLESADPDFFIAHFDVEAILTFPIEDDPHEAEQLNFFHVMCETFRTMPKATIAMIDGRVGGGGAELSAACDMRFGSLERMVLNQMEVPLGIIPGGGGTQRIPRLVGRGRAMEIILGGIDVDAVTAERWGWLNRALPGAELRGYVDALAARIATFPLAAIAASKHAVLRTDADVIAGLRADDVDFRRTSSTPTAQHLMREFLAKGGQTRDGELDVANLVMRLDRPTDA